MAGSMRRLVEPLRARPFRALAAGAFTTSLADWLAVPALVAWVYGHASTTGVALLLLARLAPPLAGSALAAVLVERYPRGKLLLAVHALYAACTAAVVAGVVVDSLVLALAALAGTGALSAVSLVCTRTLVPELVDDARLQAANSLLGTAGSVATTVGAIAGGAAVALTGVVPSLLAGAALSVVGVAFFAGVRGAGCATASRGGAKGGWRDLGGSRAALVVVGAFVSGIAATALLNATLPQLLNVDLGLGEGGYGFGFAAISGGIALGQACTGALSKGATPVTVGGAIASMGVLAAAIGVTPNAAAVLVLLFAVGAANGVAEVLMVTIVQREIDPRLHGRAFAAAHGLMRAALVAALLATPVVSRFGDAGELVAASGLWLLATGAGTVVAARARPPLRTPRRTKEATMLQW